MVFAISFGKKVLEIIQSVQDVLVSLFDVDDGWSLIQNNCKFFQNINIEESSDILTMIKPLISEEDQGSYEVFYQKVLHGIKGAADFKKVEENRMNVFLHLVDQGQPCHHKVECYFEKDKSGAITSMMTMVVPLDAEEIYRLTLAQNITNDRSPAMFISVANELINKAPEKKYALIQFDVAKFKAINEMYGEHFGDELLNYFLESLKILCNQDQLYVRLTADVFMILVSYETREDILAFVELLNNNLLNYKDTAYRLVFGICEITDIHLPLRKFGDHAALARQSLKANALEHVAFYEEGMKNSVLNSKHVEDHMGKALANHEFVMYLQPKYSIEKNVVVGAEGLVRWFQDGKMIPPDQFIPIFEKNGFIKKMDAYIWEEACKTIRRWMDSDITPVPISVNVSRVHLDSGSFITVLNNLVEQYRIPKELLEIEITETVGNTDLMVEHITTLKEQGFVLLMDDFGSGYSSLNTLKDTQFDVVKIDKCFLQDFIGSERGQKIVEHTISMTKAIGLDLVAEGVETREQAEFLSDCGCDTAQGFYYAKPMPVPEFEKLLCVKS